ncbi:MAG: hypothetical protein HY205_01435, partial [Nitrospirae bacterium]|nr:hypothetical protein [Nitrospirota bacterium]
MKPSWAACFYSALLVGAALLPSPVFSAPPGNRTDQPDFMAVLHAQSPSLSYLTSDADALTLFASTLGPALELKDSAAVLMSKQSS